MGGGASKKSFTNLAAVKDEVSGWDTGGGGYECSRCLWIRRILAWSPQPFYHPSLSLLNSSPPIPPQPPPALFSPLQLSKPPDASDVEAANAVEEVKRLRALIRTHSEGAKAATLMSAALDTEEGKAELRKVGYE